MLAKYFFIPFGLALIAFSVVLGLSVVLIIVGAAAVGLPLLLDCLPDAGKKHESEEECWDRDHEYTGWHGEQVTTLRKAVRTGTLEAWAYDHELSLLLAQPEPRRRMSSITEDWERSIREQRVPTIILEEGATMRSLEKQAWLNKKARQTLADVAGEKHAMEVELYRKRVQQLTEKYQRRSADLLDAPVRACEVPSDGRHKVSDDPRDGLRLEGRWA